MLRVLKGGADGGIRASHGPGPGLGAPQALQQPAHLVAGLPPSEPSSSAEQSLDGIQVVLLNE